jgi:hypothetical protein
MKSRIEMLNRSVSESTRLARDSASLAVESRRGRNSILAGILIATSATIALFLGLAHIYLTFFTRAFAARDAALEEKLQSVSPRISDQTTMWRAGVGFHASHALGVIFFGLVYGYLALAEREFLIRSPFLVVLGALVLLGYVVLAKLFWFDRPLVGVGLALACYVAGVAVAYA